MTSKLYRNELPLHGLFFLTLNLFSSSAAQPVEKNDSTPEVIDIVLSGLIPTLVFIFFEEGIGQDRNFNWWRSLLGIIDDIIILIIPSISGLILHMDYYRRDLAFIFVSILITFLILLMMLHFKGYIESRYMENTPKSFEEFAKMVEKILNSLPYQKFFTFFGVFPL